jgi:hypothetical protein
MICWISSWCLEHTHIVKHRHDGSRHHDVSQCACVRTEGNKLMTSDMTVHQIINDWYIYTFDRSNLLIFDWRNKENQTENRRKNLWHAKAKSKMVSSTTSQSEQSFKKSSSFPWSVLRRRVWERTNLVVLGFLKNADTWIFSRYPKRNYSKYVLGLESYKLNQKSLQRPPPPTQAPWYEICHSAPGRPKYYPGLLARMPCVDPRRLSIDCLRSIPL